MSSILAVFASSRNYALKFELMESVPCSPRRSGQTARAGILAAGASTLPPFASAGRLLPPGLTILLDAFSSDATRGALARQVRAFSGSAIISRRNRTI